jgi:hypothetical protein
VSGSGEGFMGWQWWHGEDFMGWGTEEVWQKSGSF